MQEILVQPRLGRSGVRPPVVLPASQRRHGHQNRLRTTARLQAEQSAPIVKQIEFDVAPPPVQLKVSLALAPGPAAAPFDDRHVSGQKMITDAARQREAVCKAAVVEVIEEQT